MDALGDTSIEGSNKDRRYFFKTLVNVIWNVLAMEIDGHSYNFGWCTISETLLGVHREVQDEHLLEARGSTEGPKQQLTFHIPLDSLPCLLASPMEASLPLLYVLDPSKSRIYEMSLDDSVALSHPKLCLIVTDPMQKWFVHLCVLPVTC